MNRSKAQYSMTFAFYFTIAIVVLYGALFALEKYAPNILASPAFVGAVIGGGFAAMILPLAVTAKSFVTNEKRKMSFGEGWSLTFMFTIIAFVISIVLTVADNFANYGTTLGGADMDELTADPIALGIVIGFMFIATMLTFRIFLWAGVKGEMKKLQRG